MKLESETIWAHEAWRCRERAESEKAQKSSNQILEKPESQCLPSLLHLCQSMKEEDNAVGCGTEVVDGSFSCPCCGILECALHSGDHPKSEVPTLWVMTSLGDHQCHISDSLRIRFLYDNSYQQQNYS